MNAWLDEFDGLAIRSVALPRNRGVFNPTNKYRLDHTDVRATMRREQRRLDAERQAAERQAAAQRSAPAAVIALNRRAAP